MTKDLKNRKCILDYPVGSNITAKVFIRANQAWGGEPGGGEGSGGRF